MCRLKNVKHRFAQAHPTTQLAPKNAHVQQVIDPMLFVRRIFAPRGRFQGPRRKMKFYI